MARRLVDLLRGAGAEVTGFTTEEIREGGTRVGFAIEAVSGKRSILAHVDFPGPPHIGKYGVDLDSFERLALPSLEASTHVIVVIDELGKMELASERFRDAVTGLFERSGALVATVHAYSHPFTDRLKVRGDVEVIRLTPGNRDTLPEALAACLPR